MNSAQIDIQHNRRVLREPDEFRDAVSGMSLMVNYKKRQERFSMVEQFQTRHWALDFGNANAHTRVRGMLRGGWASFCLTRGPGSAVWNGQSAANGSAALLPPNNEVDGFTTPEFFWLTAAVPLEVWRDSLALSGVDETGISQLTVCPLPAALFKRIDGQLHWLQGRICQGMASSPVQTKIAQDDATLFVSDCFTLLCGLTGRSGTPATSLRNRTRLVRLAETWMHDHLAEPVRVVDACRALKVSRRELEYAFRSIIDQSPRDYFQSLRLHAVRKALLRPDARNTSLIQIAYAHGVTHLGRFASNYRNLFGENPAATMRHKKSGQ